MRLDLRRLCAVAAVVALATCSLARDAQAGPVFTEWYWGPIFFTLFFGPWILLAAALLRVGLGLWLRRRKRPTPRFFFVRILLLCLTLAVAGVVAWDVWINVRADAFNPYTETCKQHGFKGARGNSCY